MTATGADHLGGPPYDGGQGDLVAALVELRNAITPLVEDLVIGIRPPIERWLEFVGVVSSVIPLCRQQALSAPDVRSSQP